MNRFTTRILPKLYIFAFIVSIIISLLSDTVISEISIFSNIRILIYALCMSVFLVKIFMSNKYHLNIILVLLLIIVSLIAGVKSKRPDLPVIITMIFATKDVSYFKLVKYFLMTVSSCTLIIVMLSVCRLLPNIQLYKNFYIRDSFGFEYPLGLSTIVLVICIAFSVLSFRNIKWVNIIIIFVISYITYYFTISMSDFYCSLILIVILVIYKINNHVFSIFPFSFMWLSMVIMTCITFFYAIFYNDESSFYVKFNEDMEDRLYYSNYALTHFHIPIFGQFIHENANNVRVGGFQTNFSNYFYIDQSMVRILLFYGIIIFCFIIISYSYRMFELHQYHLDYLIMLFLIILIYSFTDNKFFELCYNPFIFILFSNVKDFIQINNY